MTISYDKNKVKVIPKELVEHTNYNELIGIRNHKYYSVNLLSGKITYRKGSLRIPTGKNTIMAAKDEVAKQLKILESGESETKVARDLKGVLHPKFKEIWLELMEEKKVGKAKATGQTYDKSWNHGIKFFWENKTTKDATTANLSKYKAEYLNKNPTRVFNDTYVHFGMLLRYMLKRGDIKEMPDLDGTLGDLDQMIRSNNQMEEVGRALTPKESEMILEGVDKYFETSKVSGTSLAHKKMLHLRTKIAVLMGLKCGMRKMEILSREWDNYDKPGKIMRVWSMKNKEWRDVPLIDEICELLESQRQFAGDSKFIFPMPTNSGRNISGQVLDKAWDQVRIYSKVLGRIRFHDLRHTFATRTAELGMPPIIACEILDQSFDTYQNTYCNTSTASKTEWMKKLFEVKP